MMVGERVIVSAIEPEHIPAIVRWRNDPDVYAGFVEYEPLSSIGQRMFLEQLAQERSRRLWLVSVRAPSPASNNGTDRRVAEDACPVGTIGLIDVDLRNRRCELGAFLIGERDHRRFDVVAEAELLVLRHCFEHLGLHKVYAYVTDSNRRVTRLHRSLGFTEEACLREHVFRAGRFMNLHVLSILHEEYEQRYGS